MKMLNPFFVGAVVCCFLTGCNATEIPHPIETELYRQELFPNTKDTYLLELQEEIKKDETKLEWFVTIQKEFEDCDFELMALTEHRYLKEDGVGLGVHLLFQINMTRSEYISYATEDGKAFDDEFFMRDMSSKYSNTLFELIDSEGYTIYSYENGEGQIKVLDWLTE